MKDRVKSALILIAITAACMPFAVTRILYFGVAGGLCAYEYSKSVEKLNARCTLWVMIVYLAAQALLVWFHAGLFVYAVLFELLYVPLLIPALHHSGILWFGLGTPVITAGLLIGYHRVLQRYRKV